MIQFHQSQIASANEKDAFILLGLCMASWNQILDPWVYILLRRGVLSRVFSVFYTQKPQWQQIAPVQTHAGGLSVKNDHVAF